MTPNLEHVVKFGKLKSDLKCERRKYLTIQKITFSPLSGFNWLSLKLLNSLETWIFWQNIYRKAISFNKNVTKNCVKKEIIGTTSSLNLWKILQELLWMKTIFYRLYVSHVSRKWIKVVNFTIFRVLLTIFTKAGIFERILLRIKCFKFLRWKEFSDTIYIDKMKKSHKSA